MWPNSIFEILVKMDFITSKEAQLLLFSITRKISKNVTLKGENRWKKRDRKRKKGRRKEDKNKEEREGGIKEGKRKFGGC